MPRAMWTGSLSFGLVMIPVKLYPATNPQDVRFHELTVTGQRVRHQRVVTEAPDAFEPPPEAGPAGRGGPAIPAPGPVERREVGYEEVVKGYEVEPGSYVTVTREELEALRPERTRSVDIEGFVDLARIDPVYFEKSYWVVPQGDAAAERPYALLVQAMERAGKVGIGRVVLRTKEHLAAIRPARGVLMLETLFHADEIRDPADLYRPAGDVRTGEREARVAERLIELLAAEWDPTRHVDRYRQRVAELLEAKAGRERVVVDEHGPAAEVIPDLMEALKASVEAAKRLAGDRDAGRRTG